MGRPAGLRIVVVAAVASCLSPAVLTGCSEPAPKTRAEAEKEMFKPTDVNSLSPAVRAHLPKGGAQPPKDP